MTLLLFQPKLGNISLINVILRQTGAADSQTHQVGKYKSLSWSLKQAVFFVFLLEKVEKIHVTLGG